MDVPLAWIGTGPCHPDKDLYEVLAVSIGVAGWSLLAWVVTVVCRADHARVVKVGATMVLVAGGLLATALLGSITVLALACSG